MTTLQELPRHDAPYLIDGHVHLHDCFDENRFFQAAAANFAAAGRTLGLSQSPFGILMLTEGTGNNRFRALQERASGSGQSDLRIQATGEERSLFVIASDQSPVLLIEGRQLMTVENLEVLALGCTAELKDGSSLADTIEMVRNAGALPVVPWGVGKWRFGRRRVLLDTLSKQPPEGVLLGDNGGRASLLPKSSVFRGASRKGIRDLPGSDPLPLAHEETRAGSFGFLLEETLDPLQPATHLLSLLARPDWVPKTYGNGLSAVRFLRNQVAMQARKWHSSYPTPS